MAETRRARGSLLAKDGQKVCCHCDRTLPVSEFTRESRRADGLHSYCKECMHARQRAWHKEKVGDRKWYFREKRYGITREEFGAILVSQEGQCPICQEPLSEERAVVDHCHQSGRPRGLLCQRCNTAVGHVETSRDRLPRILAYLTKHGA